MRALGLGMGLAAFMGRALGLEASTAAERARARDPVPEARVEPVPDVPVAVPDVPDPVASSWKPSRWTAATVATVADVAPVPCGGREAARRVRQRERLEAKRRNDAGHA